MAMHNLGSSLRALGRYADALRLDEETRSRRTATLGVDHPDTLTSLWSVAQDLIKLDRGVEAVPLLDECLQRAVGKHVHQNFPEVADFRLRYFQKAKDAEGVPDDRRAVGEAATHRRGKPVPGRRLPGRHRRGAEASECARRSTGPGSPRTRLTEPWPGSRRPSPPATTMSPR